MAMDILKKEVKVQFRQLEALILFMAGATLASLQIIHYVFLNSGVAVTVFQMLLDWLFGMSIISLLVHFSFREIYKIHNELVIQREQASKAEKRIQHIIDTTQDIIFTLDRDGNFTFANKAIESLSGYSLDKILTNNIRDILSPEYRPFIFEQLKQYKDIAGRHLYMDVMKNDGKKTPVEVSFMPIKNRGNELTGFQGIARDIEERREIEKAQKDKEHCLKAIARVGQVLLENRKEIPYKKILEILCNTSDIHSAFILLNDLPNSGKVSDILSNKAKSPLSVTTSNGLQNPKLYVNYISGGSSGNVKAQSMSDLMGSDGLGQGFMELSKKEGAIISSSNGDLSSLILPVMVNSEFAGVVGFDKKADSKGWRPVEINLLATSINMIAQALERQKVNAQIKLHFIQLTKMISRAMFAVDPYTVSHQERLATLAVTIGEKAGLNSEELEWLRVGALLHDIGKAAVPNTILSKPGKLTDEEWVLIRSHVKRGHEMLQDMDLPENVMDMVLNHHERLDGSGYPNGIKGDKLSTESRILGICDVVEAMSSHRPYRPARKKDEIITELKSGRDRIYDPRVVDILIDVVERNEFDFDFATVKN
ncbi:MAG: HD domain-containing phosphohydrolase [Dehalococcoidia bacterium]|jgi:PAS domain S-box-containing protein/putative nucleotidyltransferase with HDIG domain